MFELRECKMYLGVSNLQGELVNDYSPISEKVEFRYIKSELK